MFRILFKICIKFKLTSLIAYCLLFKNNGYLKKKGKRYRLLALNHSRFNQDLELLEKTGEFKIYKLPFSLAIKVFKSFL